ncbi:heparinase II/III-family protein [Pseudooceanicola sp.]|uniref:heparinase II/III-family protein n=1 Tax=Pseudooceanicola sp. TaxID=1914328 RepID=UPI0035C738FB
MRTKVSTYARLGTANIARVAAYRLGLKSGRHPVQRLAAKVAEPPFYRASERAGAAPPANTSWDTALWWFGWHHEPMSATPPNWFADPFSSGPQPDATLDWWRISDFGSDDIKNVWELSRFDWVVAWSTMAANGDAQALDRLNHWLADWARANRPFKGPNWKCGQEASIRVMHLVTAAWVLGQDHTPEAGLVDLVITHLARIAPTMSYAIGQQNNHGTSEAAALFIGGSFLANLDPRADAWARKGRRWLEERAATLIELDGSFSQYSVTYHRLMLDTYSLAEAWRRHRNLPAFSARLRERLGAAADWLWAMTDAETGDAPNIGANDGARLLQLSGTDYRDFRPSVQLATSLFRDAKAFGSGPWNNSLNWLDLSEGQSCDAPSSRSFVQGGFHVLRKPSTLAVLRYPRFRFRPSQADALHVDLWHHGINLLRDAGTYSYNADGAEWFSGTSAHNTIVFDGRDQMPRLWRFLFGDWLKAEGVEPVDDDGVMARAAAGYTDAIGAQHHRTITLNADGLTCRDTISGAFETACLRWRLAPGEWRFDGDVLRNGAYAISIEVDGEPTSPTLSTTIESRYYQQKTEIPEISVKVGRPATLVTKVTF